MRNQVRRSEIAKRSKKLFVLIAAGTLCSCLFAGGVSYSGATTVTTSSTEEATAVTTLTGTEIEFLIAQGNTAESSASDSINTLALSGALPKVDVYRTKAVTEKREIEYKQVRVANDQMAEGETKVTQAGVNGVIEDVYTVKYLGDIQVDKALESSNTIQEPVNEIVEYGTKPKSDKGFTYSRMLSVRATAYESTFGSRNGKPGITASGLPLQVGMIAVDPKVIPLGTRCYIEDPNGVYNFGYVLAADTGGGIKGNKIDVCVPTYNDAIQFGVRQLNIYILD